MTTAKNGALARWAYFLLVAGLACVGGLVWFVRLEGIAKANTVAITKMEGQNQEMLRALQRLEVGQAVIKSQLGVKEGVPK